MQPSSFGFQPGNGAGRDAFGCQHHGLADDAHIAGGHIDFFRKGSRAGAPGLVETPASDRGFLAGISLAGDHHRRIFSQHHSRLHEFDANSVYLWRFDEDYKADLQGSFDFILMEVSTASLDIMAEEADARGVTELRQTVAEVDPLLGGLVRSLFSTMVPKAGYKVAPHNTLLADELCTAVAIHLVHHYGNGRFGSTDRRRRLSERQETRSKEILDASPCGTGIETLAGETGMSGRAFIEAFRETVGMTPHRWATRRMIEKAQSLLGRAGLSPVAVGKACGFADLIEFEQAFRNATGLGPADWQRASRS
ncbi:helix-turn-helix domain-containing protein [Neorhizobium alkalisoli]|uniref:AraC-like DNA-binding protein n=1 Tax=Neorhizobium alkalisoli TaxID=528178 RepID=A0A561QPF2_9HYPH|nr:helix-turn-helix domain-containing protein [Neorhizobium alkalisoli]TWF52271.1 AraC-like DNA-binding protein [Neorhizobium alkalisoli]